MKRTLCAASFVGTSRGSIPAPAVASTSASPLVRRWLAGSEPGTQRRIDRSQTAGNGSLMRLAPVAIRFWRDRQTMRDVAARQSATTHAAPEAIDACVAFAEVLADAIEGRPRSEVLRDRADHMPAPSGRSWLGRGAESSATKYEPPAMSRIRWRRRYGAVGRTGSFEEAVLLAANLGEDADTTAAITGQLAGALYGADGIPQRWLDRLAWEPRIRNMAERIVQ